MFTIKWYTVLPEGASYMLCLVHVLIVARAHKKQLTHNMWVYANTLWDICKMTTPSLPNELKNKFMG